MAQQANSETGAEAEKEKTDTVVTGTLIRGIAPLVIQRVEAMTDGGSAVYGSDALGGVINFITREHYEGVQVSANYGIGDAYTTCDVGAIVGKDWGTGSAYVSYRYAKSDAIFGVDRDFASR